MDTNKKFGYKKMQELLPDYAFDRISEEDREIFESTLPDFPDLIKEIRDVRNVFGRVETMNLEDRISGRTRNLSVKVQSRLRKESLVSPYFKLITKFVVPVAGLLLLGLLLFGDYIFYPENINGTQKIAQAEYEPVFDLDPSSASIILDRDVSDSVFIEITNDLNIAAPILDENDLAEAYNDEDFSIEEIINQILSDDILSENSYISGSYSRNYTSLLDELENLPEDEFQTLLEEIENEDFITGS